ncbi:MAG: ROK family transcriptional regulator [Oscillospiraceae bacterium]
MNKVVGQPQFLKEVNINIITDIILQHSPITKPEIARISGLSLPTVNKIVLGLENQNLVKKAGMEGAGVGRKAQLYVINENSGNVITLYFVNDFYICCVNNMVGDIIYRFTVPVDTSSRQSALSDTVLAIKRLIDNAKNHIVAIGIGVPGIVRSDNTISGIPSIPGWENLNLSKIIFDEFKIPTIVENDVKLSTFGFFSNNFENKNSMVYIYLGKGIGSGMILNKKIFKGNDGFSGEFGYMITDNNYNDCENSSQAVGYLEQQITSIINNIKSDEISKERLVELKEKLSVYLAKVIANFVCIVNPEVIVLKGSVLSLEIINRINEIMKKYIPKENIPVIMEDRSDMSGVDGLLKLCVTSVSSNYNIVKG